MIEISGYDERRSLNYKDYFVEIKSLDHIADIRFVQNVRTRTTYPSGIIVRDRGEHAGVPILVVAQRVRVPECPREIGAAVNSDNIVGVQFHCRRCRTAVVTHRFGYVSFPSDGGDGGGGGGGGGALFESTVLAVAAAHDSAATPVSVPHDAPGRTVFQATATESMRNCITAFTRNRVNTTGHTFGLDTCNPSQYGVSRATVRPRTVLSAQPRDRHSGATPRRALNVNICPLRYYYQLV